MTKVAGHFHLRVVNAETGAVRQEREFDNLVTDIGLEYYARGWPNTDFSCVVGSGTNEPNVQDTTLGNIIAKTGISLTTGAIGGAPDYVRSQKLSGRFAAGAISGTITEIGVVHSILNILWCRQLILDEQGNPTSLTVLDNEFLDVTYTLYTYPNLQDKTFLFVMDGVTYNCTSRLALAARSGYAVSGSFFINIYLAQLQNVFSTQQLGDITGQPGGTSVAAGIIASSLPWDASAPHSRESSLTMALNQANVQGGIGSMLLVDREGPFYHQISFNPVLPKDNTVKMTLIFSDTVSRYSAP